MDHPPGRYAIQFLGAMPEDLVLAGDYARWPSLLERLPSLAEIVRTLVEL